MFDSRWSNSSVMSPHHDEHKDCGFLRCRDDHSAAKTNTPKEAVAMETKMFTLSHLSLQLSPFPFDQVKAEVERFCNADLVWCQEEHKNQGYYDYVKPRIRTTISRSKGVW